MGLGLRVERGLGKSLNILCLDLADAPLSSHLRDKAGCFNRLYTIGLDKGKAKARLCFKLITQSIWRIRESGEASRPSRPDKKGHQTSTILWVAHWSWSRPTIGGPNHILSLLQAESGFFSGFFDDCFGPSRAAQKKSSNARNPLDGLLVQVSISSSKVTRNMVKEIAKVVGNELSLG